MTDFLPIDDAEMFDYAPISLWLEDFSGVKALFDEWRTAGVTDLRTHLASDPSRIKACSARIRVLRVNQRTLSLFEASDLPELVANLGCVFRDDMLERHVEELNALWEGGPSSVPTRSTTASAAGAWTSR